MCGIVYIKRKDGKPANRSVRKRYFKQKGRGTSGFGYVAIKDNEVVAYERAPTEHEIMEKLAKETAPEILFHHRFPTSTPNMEEQAHPLFVADPSMTHQYFVVHNGVIRNAIARKEAHTEMGIEYRTELKPLLQTVTNKLYNFGEAKFNDSESLAIDTALALEGKVRSIDSEGAAAVVGLILDGSKVVDRFFYHNLGNPLVYHTDINMTTLTSAGVGKEVNSIYIHQLKEDGSMEEHPIKVWSPYVYRYSNYAGTPPTQAGTHTLQLPKSSMDLSGLNFHEGPSTDLLQDHSKSQDFLRLLPDSLLWEEWKKAEKHGKEIADMLIKLDTALITGNELEKIATLHLRLERVKAYALRIELELQNREGDGTILIDGLQGARNQSNITG